MNFDAPERIAYRPREAAELLGVSVPHVRRLLADGELPGVRSGGRWLIPRQALMEWLAALPTGGQRPAASE